MAKTKAPARKMVFGELDEAKTAAREYGSTEVKKDGTPKTYKVYKCGEDYVVANSNNSAVINLNIERGFTTPELVRVPKFVKPKEYVNYCNMDDLEELLEAVTARKEELEG